MTRWPFFFTAYPLLHQVWGLNRRRLKKSPLRPKRVAIYGPNQEILKTVRVDPGGEAVDTTEDDLEERASFERYLEQQRAEEAKRQGR
jgi:hypothetical protein